MQLKLAELLFGAVGHRDFGIHQLRPDVFGGVLALFGGKLGGVGEQLAASHSSFVFGDFIFRVGRADDAVRPVKQLVALVHRHAHQFGDGLKRKLGRHIHHEIALAAADGIQDVYRPLAQMLFQEAHGLGGEASVHQLAQAGVAGRVLQDHLGAHAVFGRLVYDADAAVRGAVSACVAAEGLPVAMDGHDVVIF